MIGRKIRSKLASIVTKVRIAYFRFMGIKIGERCFISFGAHLDMRRGKLTIGNNVDIAHGTYVLSHTGFKPLKEGEETVIEDNVKIYVRAIILPGIRVGKNSIIGAGSVVIKDVPPNVIVMGNPARIIKHLDEKE